MPLVIHTVVDPNPSARHPLCMSFKLDPKLEADTVAVVDWDISTVRLMNDSRYPWLVLIPRRVGMRDLIDLAPEDRQCLTAEIDRATRTLKDLSGAYKMNVASLGNIVEQLHVHVIARHKDDDAWPGPVWGVHPPKPYDDDSQQDFLSLLRNALG